MKTILQKISVLLLCAILICSALPSRAVAGYQIPGACQVQTESGTAAVKTLDCDYDNNTYLSLRDAAMALNGTEKSFSLDVASNAVSLNLGEAYAPLGGRTPPGERRSFRMPPCGGMNLR